MIHFKKIIALISVYPLITFQTFAETYTVSKSSPTSSSINFDSDGKFTVSIPFALWTDNSGPITRRYGTLYERRIKPDGSIFEYSSSVTPGTTKNYTNRLRGTTEFYQIKTCNEYLNQPTSFQCSFSPVYLSVQSFPNQVTLTTNNTAAPKAGIDLLGGNP